jgi:hypothetical protein
LAPFALLREILFFDLFFNSEFQIFLASILNVVVLPAPFGPSKPKTAPRFTETVNELRQYVRQTAASKTMFPRSAD